MTVSWSEYNMLNGIVMALELHLPRMNDMPHWLVSSLESIYGTLKDFYDSAVVVPDLKFEREKS